MKIQSQEGKKQFEKRIDANGTGGSQAVTHPSTNPAQRCLTSVIGRELVCSTWYGRWREEGAKSKDMKVARQQENLDLEQKTKVFCKLNIMTMIIST